MVILAVVTAAICCTRGPGLGSHPSPFWTRPETCDWHGNWSLYPYYVAVQNVRALIKMFQDVRNYHGLNVFILFL